MKKSKFLAVCILLPLLAISGKIDRGFEALSIYDYFKAKKLFYKSLKRNELASAYGLSLIYGRNDNPFYNLDSAYKYVALADTLLLNIDEKLSKKLVKLNVDSSAIVSWKDTIDFKVFKKIVKTNTIEGFQYYIDKHDDSKQKNIAIHKRDSLAFLNAKKNNTSFSYYTFMETYPQSIYKVEAKNRYEERLFYETASLNSEQHYYQFIQAHPENPYISQAQDSIYKIRTSTNKIESYYSFIKSYPENRNVIKAWKTIYKLYTTDFSAARIVEFQIDYPDYPFIEDLKIDMKLASKKFYPVNQADQWGYMDQEANIMIEYLYDFAEPFKEGLALVMLDKKIGFVNKSGQIAVPLEYDDAESFQNGIAITSKNGKYGIIDKTNRVIVDFKYEEIGPTTNELILVANENAYGYINKKGKEIIPLKYEIAYDFKNGYAIVKDSSKYGIINKHGDYVIENKFSWIEPFDELGRCKAKYDSLFGVLDANGGVVLPFIYGSIGSFNDSLILIAKDEKYGFANYNGEIVIPIEFDFNPNVLVYAQFNNGFAKYLLKEKIGVINTKAEKVVPAIFEDMDEYSDLTFFAVKKRGKWGYSDQNLRLAIPYKFQYAKTFKEDIGIVKEKEKWYFINKDGQPINQYKYDNILYLLSNYYLVENENKKGLLNNQLEVVLPTKYELIEEYDSETLKLELEGEVMYFDRVTNRVIKANRF
ncbi:MAG: WG repeat-containing protein [Bacteroidetes bacterium]|nr:MAG: WG repeat-containing protein [Bacteroidota bacterium]MBL1146047.1 WG repeat-containing protein [Bacteroidota bacterium]NOG58841.1 WG repeat-containing protein [Bacteroidota bacterium]